jgi:5'-nucleotidase (lipoprotein e(P4) family)
MKLGFKFSFGVAIMFGRRFILISILSVFTFSCTHSLTKPTSDKLEVPLEREYQIGSYLWYQTSGEFRALSYQAYNLARLKLDRDLEEKHNGKRAVVFDIDETVLDNSAAGAYELKNKIGWSRENLKKWFNLKKAEAIPGAAEFIKYALSQRVEVLFITNREEDQKEATLENLKNVGIDASSENVYFMNRDWSKEERRKEVLKKYHVVMYLGDNLSDFHKDWDKKPAEERRALVDLHQAEFGDTFIIIPNPLYGDWETALPQKTPKLDLLKSVPY